MNQPSNIRYSIVIAAYNAANTINECLAALNQQTIPREQYEIIVVDDASQDNTSQLAQAAGAVVFRHESNLGPGGTRNVGINNARGDIICFTDSDCIAFPNWLEAITQPLRDDPTIGGSKGIYQTKQRAITARFVQLEYENKYDNLKRHPYIAFIDTYAAAFRRDILLDCGGFDERFLGGEDRELSYRIAAQGHRLVYQPTAIVYHYHADNLPLYFKKKQANGYWGGHAMSDFPELQKQDSYTPQTLKIQVGLMALILLTLPFTFLFAAARYLLLIQTGTFTLTMLPFLRKAWAKDKPIAFIAPLYLTLRALAIGLGYTWRLLKPLNHSQP